jgi:DNA-binding transcriptional LysR family regulator
MLDMQIKHVHKTLTPTRTDLNLLALFDVVYRLRNLTAAGAELGLSQPAMSRALGRLRDTYGDPLFVRHQRGVQPTPLADHLAAPVAQALTLLRGAAEQPGFDPATTRRRFKLALSDIAERFFLPRLASQLARVAPGASVESVVIDSTDLAHELGVGAADMALGYLPALGKQVRMQRLFRESYVYVARKGHPAVRGRLTHEQLRNLPHVLVDPPGTLHAQAVERSLPRAKTGSPIAMRVRSFLCVGPIVEQSDLVAVVPNNLAQLVSQHVALQLIAPPRPIGSFDVSMAWHQRYHRDPAIEWLRECIAALQPLGGSQP